MANAQAAPAAYGRETVLTVLAAASRSHTSRYLAIEAAAAGGVALAVVLVTVAWWPVAAFAISVAAYAVWGLLDRVRSAAAASRRGESTTAPRPVGAFHHAVLATQLALVAVGVGSVLAGTAGLALRLFTGDAPGPYGMCTRPDGRAYPCDARGRPRAPVRSGRLPGAPAAPGDGAPSAGPLAPATRRTLAGAAAVAAPVGIRVDTAGGPRPALLALWRAYLAAGPDRYEPAPQWSDAEQRRWRVYDLTTPWVYGSAPDRPRPTPLLVGLDPVAPEREDAFVLRTLYSTRDSATGAVLPVALARTYAVRERGRWVLANALPRLTAGWPRARRGAITFVYAPTHRFDDARARRSAAFVDSLARAMGVARPAAVEFYVADRPEELARIVGLDLALPETANGRAYPANVLVLSGLPAYGEWYPHELAHLVMTPLTFRLETATNVDEGLAMWLGGSKGKPFPVLMRELAADLAAHPARGLDSLLGPGAHTDSTGMRAGAALAALAHARGGVAAVKAVLSPARTAAGPDHLVAAERALGLDRAALRAAWRATVQRAATP